VETVYTTSPSIIVGTVLYTNSGLTTLFIPNPVCTDALGQEVYRTGACLPLEDGSFTFDGFTINGSGVVTSVGQLLSCQ
jgi:hypothetical protein